MKHWKLFTLTAVWAVFGLAIIGLAACNNGNNGKPEISGGETVQPIFYTGAADNGEELIIEITQTPPVSRAALTPQNGDYYVIRLAGIIISSGTVSISTGGGELTFEPSDGGESFTAAISGPNRSLTITGSISYDGGTISGISAVEADNGGNNPAYYNKTKKELYLRLEDGLIIQQELSTKIGIRVMFYCVISIPVRLKRIPSIR